MLNINLYYFFFIANKEQKGQSEGSNNSNFESETSKLEWLNNSSFKPEALKLFEDGIKENEKLEHELNIRNSYKLYKKLHGKKKKKKNKKHLKKIKRPK